MRIKYTPTAAFRIEKLSTLFLKSFRYFLIKYLIIAFNFEVLGTFYQKYAFLS